MTREEEIKQAALQRDCDGDFDSNDGLNGFIEGAEWADEHQVIPQDIIESLKDVDFDCYDIELVPKKNVVTTKNK